MDFEQTTVLGNNSRHLWFFERICWTCAFGAKLHTHLTHGIQIIHYNMYVYHIMYKSTINRVLTAGKLDICQCYQ